MSNEVQKATMAASKWALVWQPLFAQYPAPWVIQEHPETILIKDASGTIVLQYNQHSHPQLTIDDRKHNAQVLVNTVNNF